MADRRLLAREAGATYADLRAAFRWDVPARFNIGTACSATQDPAGTALVDVSDTGVRRATFGDLTERSARLANGLAALGVARGDRVAILLPQGLEAGLTHLAISRLGAVALPLTQLFGPDAIRFRVGDAGARVLVTDPARLDVVAEVGRDLGDLAVVVAGADPPHPFHGFDALVRDGAPTLVDADTAADDPALLIYTSGTTGNPKGALHGHRVLFGHLPGFELMYDFFPAPADVVWTPADWAWIGGLMDALIPAWFHGRTVVATAKRRFDPEWAVRVLADHQVTCAFLPPTALKLMRQAGVAPGGLPLRAVMSGGEPLGAEMLAWGERTLGVTINEIYGQTEANILVGNCASVWPVRPGSMGRPYPGHDVVVLGADDRPAAPGDVGEVAVRAPDPVMLLGYWNQPEATERKLEGGWLRTGDLARVDDDGYLWFHARDDDVINSAGYRIGPAEIEGCLMTHPAVAMCAVIGKPDETRGEIVKAFVQVRPGIAATAELATEIQEHVRRRLAAYEYPREVEFVSELPLTTTGKIRRRDLRDRELGRR